MLHGDILCTEIGSNVSASIEEDERIYIYRSKDLSNIVSATRFLTVSVNRPKLFRMKNQKSFLLNSEPKFHLLKFDPPVVSGGDVVAKEERAVLEAGSRKNKKIDDAVEGTVLDVPTPNNIVPISPNPQSTSTLQGVGSVPHKGSSNDILPETSISLRELMDRLIPPVSWEEGGVKYTKSASLLQSSRQSVMDLEASLNRLLALHTAREVPLCPIREELFGELFDELIRQVSLESPEQGLILVRLRDEAKMTMAYYHSLYRSGVIFANKKLVECSSIDENEQKLANLRATRERLRRELQNLKSSFEFQKDHAMFNSNEIKKVRSYEMDYLKRRHDLLESSLKTFRNTAKQFQIAL